MSDFSDILVPCGYGPPGSLPQPLPGGVDGGNSDIPTQPPGNGPVIIINPGNPIPPVSKPPSDPPIITTNTVISVSEGEGKILIVTNVAVEVSGACSDPTGTPVTIVYHPNVFATSHLITFNGLNPETYYTYSVICRRQNNTNLKVVANGSFTTLAANNPNAPVITGNDVINVNETTGSVLIQTDVPTEVSGYCQSIDGTTTVTVFNPNVYLTSHTLQFTGLSPGTLYAYYVKCQESSFQHLFVLAQGVFTTMEVNDPPGGGSNNSADPISETGKAFNTYENIYEGYLQRTTYEEAQVDLKYTPYTIIPTGFRPVYGAKGLNIFSTVRHKSINNILDARTTSLEEAILDKENITLTDIKSSLKPEIAKSIENVKYPNGIPVSQDIILAAIKQSIIDGTVDSVDKDYLVTFPAKESTTVTKGNVIKKSNYGSRVQDVLNSRVITPSKESTPTVERNMSTGISIVKTKSRPLNPAVYSDDSKELLKLWYFIPEDINKRVYYVDTDGNEYTYYIRNDESLVYTTSDGTSAVGYLSVHDTVDFTLESGSEDDYYTISDINKAVTLNNEDDLLAKYHFNIVDDTLLQVTTTRSLEVSNTLTTLQTHYVLTLNPLTVTDAKTNDSPFITESTASYTVQDQSASCVASINDLVKFSAYPWRVFFIDYNDPILEYFEYTDTAVQVKFKDISLNYLGAKVGVAEQLYVRKIPKTIVIIPTNKTKYNLFNGASVLTDWGTRQIRFEKAPDKQLLSPGLTYSPFKIENTYLNSNGESKDGYFSTQSYHCVYDESQPTYNSSFKDSNNKPTRTDPGIKKAINVITSLSTTYDIDNGLTYYDVYNRLTRKELYNLDNTISKIVLNKLALGEQTGVKLYHIPSVKNTGITARVSPTRLIGLKTGATEEYSSEYTEPNIIEAELEIIQNESGR